MTPKSKTRSKSKPRDLFPGAVEMMILQSIYEEPMHGYALVQHIQQRSKNLLQVEEGSLYPALQRLLKDGLLFAEWKVSPNKRRVRTYYITLKGMKRLKVELSRFDRMMKGMSLVLAPLPPILLKDFIADLEPV